MCHNTVFIRFFESFSILTRLPKDQTASMLYIIVPFDNLLLKQKLKKLQVYLIPRKKVYRVNKMDKLSTYIVFFFLRGAIFSYIE